MRRRMIVLVFFATLMTGCALPSALTGTGQKPQQAPPPAQTPEEALRNAITLYGTKELPPGFQILRLYSVAGATQTQLAFYRFLRLTTDTPPRVIPMIGLQFLAREPNQWSAQGGQALARTAPTENVLDYIHITHTIDNTAITTVFGLALAPNVTMVEATFDNGQTVRESVTQESFVVVAPGANTGRELRALDTDGRVIRRFELAAPTSAGR